MEFTESIKTAKVDNVVLTKAYHVKTMGTLCLTSHHLLFANRAAPDDEMMLLYMFIEHVDKKFSGTHGVLTIITKDFLSFKLKIPGQEDALNVADSIEKLSSLESAASYYPFFYNRLNFNLKQNGWQLFSMQDEYKKIIQGQSDHWKISDVNAKHEVTGTYPSYVITPAAATEEMIKKSAHFRQGGRFPILCYLHNNKVPLLRSSQPLNGNNNKKSKEDQKLMSLYLTGFTTKGIIIDTRQSASAMSQRGRGGGYETEAHYPQWKRIPQNMDHPYTLSDSLSRLYEACCDSKTSSSWLSKLESSGWLTYVQELLLASLQVARLLHTKGGTPVLVHGEKGIDCTLQVTSLAQILLTPECRTIKGFESLITREWLWGGHPFTERHVKIGVSPAKRKKQTPVFLMFLDCVHQIMHQYPSSFEFTEDFLLLLTNHVYASEFGTFLFNNEWQRGQAKLTDKTVSLWSYINTDKVLDTITNPIYEYNKHSLWPSISPQSLVLWTSFFLRPFKSIGVDSDSNLNSIITESKKENVMLKEKAKALQMEYLKLYAENFNKLD